MNPTQALLVVLQRTGATLANACSEALQVLDQDESAPAKTPLPTGGADQPLLTVQDVCGWFKVEPSWVYDEVQAERLPFIRIGRQSLRFRQVELEQFLADSRDRQLKRNRRAPGELEPLD